MAELESSAAAASSGATVDCVGDGTDGNRVQAVYAVAEDRVDRYDDIAPLIAQWAVGVDTAYSSSAAETGGDRHVRWVTTPDCSLSVLHVVVPAAGDDSISSITNSLKAQGHNRADRKYLIWTDANVYCGIGYIYIDDQPGSTNANNGGKPGYGRIDSGCWGRTSSTEAHELMHTLGGVQTSAPHATSQWHCSDEYDRMCYNDGGVTLTYPCASTHESLFDCGHDDYFHTAPPTGSYLATHWNVANSSFLTSEPAAPDVTPPPVPSNLTATPGDKAVTLAWNAVTASDLAGYRLTRDGVVIASPTATAFTDTAVANGTTYTYTVASVDVAGNPSAPSAGVTAVPTAGSGLEATFAGALSKRRTSASYSVTAGTGPATATLVVTATGGQLAPPPSLSVMTLTVRAASGGAVAQATGAGQVELSTALAAGTYTFEVTRAATDVYKALFSLTVDYTAP